ncbi:Tyrosine aminotransferase [Zea mays]|uniref:Tyrosine aminotransferase n=1 Tax=Zea mays TaxID=4577 RepID=A0A1D6H7L8_MAIZE|nr:Tyrosine aminotransferase [Zea mays]
MLARSVGGAHVAPVRDATTNRCGVRGTSVSVLVQLHVCLAWHYRTRRRKPRQTCLPRKDVRSMYICLFPIVFLPGFYNLL